MGFGRIGACITLAVAYLALRFALPYVRPEFINPALVVLLCTALLMLAQLAFVVSIASLRLRPRSSVLLILASALAAAAMVFLEVRLEPRAPALAGALAVNLVFRDLCLMLFAGSLGYVVSFIVREPNILLPAAVFAGLVDYWNVSWGPLSRLVERKPEVITTVSVHMPMPVPGMPDGTVGIGDFVFLALFFGALYRFGLNVKGAFWLGYGLLTACMLFVLKFESAMPALVPIAIAVVGANIRNFKLQREELLATLYVGVLLLLLILASVIFLFRR